MKNNHGRQLRLLIAEDNPDDIFILEDILRKFDSISYKVVNDGEEMLAYLRQKGDYQSSPIPDMALLDIRMPKKDGYEVLKEIKSDPRLKALPVVMFSTSSAMKDVMKSYVGGASTFITKPVGFLPFQEMIHQMITYWTQVATVPDLGR